MSQVNPYYGDRGASQQFTESALANTCHQPPFSDATQSVRAGQQRTAQREHSEPIFATSSFIFESAEQAADLFAEKIEGNVYSRFTNPTVDAFSSRLGVMEGAQYCLSTASGMAAITTMVLGLLKPGDHIVASRELFGSTVSLFNKICSRFNIETTLVPLADNESWTNAIIENTRLLFVETPSNPTCQLADIRFLAELAKQVDALLVVDNCFCTPALQKPLALGADIVLHSATKFLDGQGRCVGGAIATNDKKIHDDLFGVLRTCGPSMSPFNAWVFLKGLETLKLRMRQHCETAAVLAHFLDAHPKTEQVFYPGLENHPQHDLAKQQQGGFGGILAFRIKGARQQAWKMINTTRIFSITANLGDARSTITHPASTTHARITAEERNAAGISANLLRISAGLEDAQDLIDDLAYGLATI